jgi:NTP pyrophosphatase (non-canonical NTP hydrolase)
MDDHFNELTPAETELLALLAEECGEVVHVIGKILRHGIANYHPADPMTSNRKLLEKELGDVDCAVGLLREADIISQSRIAAASKAKRESVGQYLHHFAVKPNG